jgi:hypothetical protein
MMRRIIPFAVGALAATAILLPLYAEGATRTVHGGIPTDVVMTVQPSGVHGCAVVPMRQVDAMPTAVSVTQTSHLLVTFTGEWALDPGVEGLLGFYLNGDDLQGHQDWTPFEWGQPGSRTTHTTRSVMWTFRNVPAGDYSVTVTARVDPNPPGPGGEKTSALLDNCSLTVFVMPAT